MPTGLLFRLRFAAQIGRVRALVSLDVLELSRLVPNGVEFLARAAAMRGASCFGCNNISFAV